MGAKDHEHQFMRMSSPAANGPRPKPAPDEPCRAQQVAPRARRFADDQRRPLRIFSRRAKAGWDGLAKTAWQTLRSTSGGEATSPIATWLRRRTEGGARHRHVRYIRQGFGSAAEL
jgi:hypothetical protein